MALSGNEDLLVLYYWILNGYRTKTFFRIGFGAKFLADAAYDAADVYKELHYDNVKAVIAVNDRGLYKSKKPKDKGYGKMWSIESIFKTKRNVWSCKK